MRLKNQRFFLWFNRIIFPLFYLRHQGKSEIEVDAGEGVHFNVRVNTSDILVIWEIWKAKIYDDIRFPIKHDEVVVDIGAHIGGYAVRAARQAQGGCVYAYEASSKNFALLEKNRMTNGAGNLYVFNNAIASQRGEMKFFQPGSNGALGSLMQESDSPMEIVNAITLFDIIAENKLEHIDHLKIDVEGAEYDILLECPDATLAKVQQIVLEYHEFEGHARSYRDLVDCLHAHGFNVVVEHGIFPQKFLFGTGIIKAWRG